MSELIIMVDVDANGTFTYSSAPGATGDWALSTDGSITPPMSQGSGTFEVKLVKGDQQFAGFDVCPGNQELSESHWASKSKLRACNLEALSPKPWPTDSDAVANSVKLALSYGAADGATSSYARYRIFVRLASGEVVHDDPRIYNDPVTDPPG